MAKKKRSERDVKRVYIFLSPRQRAFVDQYKQFYGCSSTSEVVRRVLDAMIARDNQARTMIRQYRRASASPPPDTHPAPRMRGDTGDGDESLEGTA